jgi:hypothetical protein
MVSGKSLYIRMQDVEHQLANLSAITSHPTISINGGAPIQLSNPVWGLSQAAGSYRLPYVFYSLPSVVSDGAAVAVSAPHGWCTAGGQPARAMDGIAAVRGALLPEVADTPKAMELGVKMARFADYVASLSPAFWVRGSGGTPFAQVGSHPVKHQAGTGVAPDILADGPLGGGQATGSMDFAGAQWVRYGTGAVDLGDKEAFTVLAWIKEKPGVWQGEQTIVDNGYASILLRTLDGSPHLAKAQLNGGYFGPFDLPGLDGGGTPVLLDGQFHMVGAKGSTSPAVKRYSVLDGAVLAPISIPGKPWLENFDDPIGPITVGGNAAVPNIPGDVTILANMQIAEVVRFDRELTVGELAKLQQAATWSGAPRPPPPPPPPPTPPHPRPQPPPRWVGDINRI